MKDIVWQIRRALRGKGCLFSICLMLYSLFFVHTDAPVFFTMPLTYFRKDCTFYYHFIISFWMGLSQYVLPIAAMLPLAFFHCDDAQSGFRNLSEYRLPRSRYLAHRATAAALSAMVTVAIACAIFTVFLLAVCTLTGGEQEAWLINRQGSAFEWLASAEHFPWFILAQYARLMVSAATWALIAVAFSLAWPNKAFTFVATFGLSILLDVVLNRRLGSEYTISVLQTPDLNTHTPLTVLFVRQLAYLGIAMIICGASIFFRSSKRMIRVKQRIGLFRAAYFPRRNEKTEWHISPRIGGTFLGEILTDIRAFLSRATMLPAMLIPIMVALCKPVFQTLRHSIGDLWIGVFGGFYWFEPQVDFTPLGLWIVLLLPPMMGVALSLEREFSSRVHLTMLRFRTRLRWWSSKSIAVFVYSVLCSAVMFLSVAALGWLTGADGFAVLLEDADGFLTPHYLVLLQCFCLFTGQIIMLTQLQALVHLAFGRMQLGVIAYLLPCIACLISYSVFDRMGNAFVPYNWGMILRSDIFSPSVMVIDNGETSPLCTIHVGASMCAQAGLAILLSGIGMLLSRVIKIAEREVKE